MSTVPQYSAVLVWFNNDQQTVCFVYLLPKYKWLALMVLCFNPLLFCYSWRANHSAKNWGSIWGDGGSVPWNVHQVPPVPFRQVQDPVWPEREWCPIRPVNGWVEALDCTSIFQTPRSLPHLVQSWCPVWIISGLQSLYMSIFAKETFALCIVTHTSFLLRKWQVWEKPPSLLLSSG